MRVLGRVLVVSLLCLAGCAQDVTEPPPPPDRLYFPTGVLHLDLAGSTEGVLHVASSNFDRRFRDGSVAALALDGLRTAEDVALPPLGSVARGSPVLQFPALGIDGDRSLVQVRSFAGEIAAWPLPEGGHRLFVPSRAEGSLLQVIDAQGDALSCFGTNARDCAVGGVELEPRDTEEKPKPRAAEPFGVGVAPNGDVFVTHLQTADSPVGSGRELEAYVVATNAAAPAVSDASFIPVGTSPTHSVAIGARYAYVSGRFQQPFGNLVRLVDRTQRGRVINPAIEGSFQVLEGRGIAIDADERRLFVAAREPDMLLSVAVAYATLDSPALRVIAAAPLPAEPNAVRVLPRPGRRSVVAVTCTGADVLVLYDDEVGKVVAEIPGVGSQPFDLAVDLQGNGARLYVTNFGDGRVAVVDVPDLNRPEQAWLVAQLGRPQTCLIEEGGSCEVPE